MVRSITLLVTALLVMSVAACSGDSGGEIVEVSFDGSECTVAEPTEVPPGDYAFLLTDVSGLDDVELYARKLVDGHTFQDALDIEKEAGGPGSIWRFPRWWAFPTFDYDPPEVDLADNQQLRPYSLEPGNHLLAIWAENPDATWLCAPLDVVEP